jgi:hypothetical protein
MPLPSPFITPPLQNLTTLLNSLGDDEAARRQLMREDFDALVSDSQNPTALSKANALREIIGKWNTLGIVVEEMKEEWILSHSLPAHVALAHSLAECVKGMAKWRKEMGERIGKIVTERIIEGRNTEGYGRKIEEEDKLTEEVEYFDLLLMQTTSALETYANSPSLTTFNRTFEKVSELGASFPWK